ncbi:MAG: hypothetical protein LQ337_004529 [Flavoplaca oasis]|nr:MAG: hypothetical protein LQ337_004529 [Flavoplaca oasis]
MGRRKIEIKAIKDDRNRSVTFLKRKGGLFKKAHELSVLCSVDVAVIIFGHNKKLYEYSSGDINETIGRFQYYGGAHEHKGPADFAGRGNLDDDDDDDMGSPPPEDQIQHEQLAQDHRYPPHLQSQPPHMRQPAQSASPPIQNGVPYYQRNHTPQPQMHSRPQSRNMGHPSNFPNRPPDFASNQASHQHHQVSQGPQGPNGYAYHPNPSIYSSQGVPNQQQPYYAQPPQPQHPQIQQAYMQDGRRQSMPPAFPQHERTQQPPHPQQHQKQQQQQQQPPQPQPQPPHPPQAMASPPQPKQEPQQEIEPNRLAKPVPAKSRSIFTPIDGSRSLLAQHWGLGNSSDSREVKMEKENRSHSVDASAMHPRNKPPSEITSPPKKASTMPQRNSLPSEIQPPPRGNTAAQMGAKRPRLKVQIPSEQSDGGSATAESSPRESGGTASETPAKASTDASHSSGVVLPPPSPSASAILSAGAQGPPNPFARPHPPSHSSNPNNSNNGGSFSSSNNNIETPISALPSRFVSDALLPSPSSFYPEWGFGRGETGNLLPSPLTFQTPVAGNGPSFLRDEEGERERERERDKKRKSPEGDGGVQGEGVGETGLKRVKT